MTVFSAALLLFLVLDPFGNIPFFLAALSSVDQRRRRRVLIRELLVALAVLIVFLFGGPFLLRAMHISESSLTVAGAILLFIISMRMVFPAPRPVSESEFEGEPFIVPLAVPFVAGPSAMAAILFIMNREPERWLEWLVAVVSAWAATAGILILSSSLSRFLGKRGLVAIERLMGMILVTLAVQMFLSGLREFLAGSAG
jgi:multiple antibiotic resistance protein